MRLDDLEWVDETLDNAEVSLASPQLSVSPEWDSATVLGRDALTALRALTESADLRSARAWFGKAVQADPVLSQLSSLAARHRVTFGVYGGSARDLLLNAGRAARASRCQQ